MKSASAHVTDDRYMSPTMVTLFYRTRFFLVFLSATTKPPSSNVMMVRLCTHGSSAFFSLLCFACQAMTKALGLYRMFWTSAFPVFLLL
jgi:hypothetical protein